MNMEIDNSKTVDQNDVDEEQLLKSNQSIAVLNVIQHNIPFSSNQMRQKHDDPDSAAQNRERLNPQQRQIFDYIIKNPNDLILLQAPAGTGKSETMRVIAEYNRSRDTLFIIFRHDLLQAFQYVGSTSTNAKFFMKMFKLDFESFKAIEKQMSGKLSGWDYVRMVTELLSIAKLPDIRDVLVCLDEYTVLNKTWLLLLLIIVDHYKIGCIISGDKNQLQTIKDSKNTKIITAYELVQKFAKQEFSLTQQMRIQDISYNVLLNFLSTFSCDRRLNALGYSMIAILFMDNFFGVKRYQQTFLASYHRDLTKEQEVLTEREQHQVSFYKTQLEPCVKYPEAAKDYDIWSKSEPNRRNIHELQFPFKFLPYLPLCIGATYYVYIRSEHELGILESINPATKTLTLRMIKSKEIVRVSQTRCEKVLSEEHLNWLRWEYAVKKNRRLPTNVKPIIPETNTKLFNFPIYPARFTSIHSCQGLTITDKININLTHSTYQALYVAMSRVKQRSQINSIEMPDLINYLLSAIIQVPELCSPQGLTDLEMIYERLENNYMHFQTSAEYNHKITAMVVDFSNSAGDFCKRKEIYRQLIKLKNMKEIVGKPINNCTLPVRKNAKHVAVDNTEINARNQEAEDDECFSESTLGFILRNLEHLKRLSCWTKTDRAFWLHEYLRVSDEFKVERSLSTSASSYRKLTDFESLSKLVKLEPLMLHRSCFRNILERCSVCTDLNDPCLISKKTKASTLFQKRLLNKIKEKLNGKDYDMESLNNCDDGLLIDQEWLIEQLYNDEYLIVSKTCANVTGGGAQQPSVIYNRNNDNNLMGVANEKKINWRRTVKRSLMTPPNHSCLQKVLRK